MEEQADQHHTWWQKIKQHPFITAGIILILFLLLIPVAYKLGWSWTGFVGKTLWDWLGLLAALAIPLVVGFGVQWYTARQGEASDKENKDNQQENALLAYIDKMSELLLKEHLGELLPNGKADSEYRQRQNGNITDELKPECEAVRKIARARTLTVLRELDGIRKGYVIQFLHECHLISTRIISLRGTDLSNVTERWAHLEGAKLNLANLESAELRDSYLTNADLSGAILKGADLSKTDLSKADLTGANLAGANLYNAIVTNEQLTKAKSLNTMRPP